jgi:hypothetical protein
MAVTFFVVRSVRAAASVSRLSEDGRRLAARITPSLPVAVAAIADTPPGSRVTARASPPAAGRIQSCAASVSFSAAASARAEMKRMSPDPVKATPDSPLAERVSRVGVPDPSAGTDQSARS